MLFLIVFTSLFSFSLYDSETIGNRIDTVNPRSAGMGATGVAYSVNGLDAAINPACLSLPENKFSFQVVNLSSYHKEDRKIPAYNYFDSKVGDAVYNQEQNFYTNFAFSAGYSHKTDVGVFSLGLAYRPAIDFNSDYSEDVRTDGDSDYEMYPFVVAKNKIKNEGSLNSFDVTLSAKLDQLTKNIDFVDDVSFGVTFSLLSGDHEYMRSITWTQRARDSVAAYFELTDAYSTTKREFSGTQLNFGTVIDVNERINLGFSFKPETDIDCDYTVAEIEKSTIDFTIPSSIRFGTTFMPRNEFRTFFNFEMELTNWSDVDESYEDVLSYYVGMEHKIENRIPLRCGFRYEHSPKDKSLIHQTITVGTGFKIVENLTMDISAIYTNRLYKQEDLFEDKFYNDLEYTNAYEESKFWRAPKENHNENEEVEESTLLMYSGLSFHW